MSKQTKKNIIICLDGTGNQYGTDKSNILKLFRMLEREPGEQIAYYDPGVGTMGDPAYKTATARLINKYLGLAFGRGLMKNMLEAYTFLMEHYNDGDKVFIFGFSRGAYTARALAAFIKECGLFERGAKNLLPYAMSQFLKRTPVKDDEKDEDDKENKMATDEKSNGKGKKKKDKNDHFYRQVSGFRSTYGRRLNREEDPRYPGRKVKDKPNYQLRIHFLGLFDTVKSYGWVSNPVILRNEVKNDSVLNVRHAISIDEKRAFFNQMHWRASKRHQTCKEVWFAGVHSDVGGGYAEKDSGLAKIALKWMVHEAIYLGLKVDLGEYGKAMQVKQDKMTKKWVSAPIEEEEERKYARPNPLAMAHESLTSWWKIVQLLPKKLEEWEKVKEGRQIKGLRTIKSEYERLTEKEQLKAEEKRNGLLVHQSVIDRIFAKHMNANKTEYLPQNLLKRLKGDINNLSNENIEQTMPREKAFKIKGVESV